MAISNGSGGIGKNSASEKEFANSANEDQGLSANPSTQSDNV